MKKKNFGIGVGFAAVLFTAVVLIAFKADEVRQTAAMPAVPQISASQAILVEAETGEVLYERNARERAYPASTTKIMTALLVLETLERYDSPIDQVVTVPREAEGVEGSSLYLKAGEKIRLEDLLYGLMLQSGNDSAVALAILTTGSTENFVAEMNAKAEELGCGNTHFVNPNGLFDENHYTTAWDLAQIAREAMRYPMFRTIVAAPSWDAQREGNDFTHFYNKNKTVHEFRGGNGIKIGYTKASGRTLAASAQRDGKELICVVMGAPNWFNDAYTLMEYGFKRLEE
ncbi:MAG: D-alanyl-D-alanine carboxypeptidase family protein [Clostridia bacterium]